MPNLLAILFRTFRSNLYSVIKPVPGDASGYLPREPLSGEGVAAVGIDADIFVVHTHDGSVLAASTYDGRCVGINISIIDFYPDSCMPTDDFLTDSSSEAPLRLNAAPRVFKPMKSHYY